MRSKSEAAVIAASASFRTRPGKLTQYGLTEAVSPSSGNRTIRRPRRPMCSARRMCEHERVGSGADALRGLRLEDFL
jgi:hypothetical protein